MQWSESQIACLDAIQKYIETVHSKCNNPGLQIIVQPTGSGKTAEILGLATRAVKGAITFSDSKRRRPKILILTPPGIPFKNISHYLDEQDAKFPDYSPMMSSLTGQKWASFTSRHVNIWTNPKANILQSSKQITVTDFYTLASFNRLSSSKVDDLAQQTDLLIVDECHNMVSDKGSSQVWRYLIERIIDIVPKAIGFTASPKPSSRHSILFHGHGFQTKQLVIHWLPIHMMDLETKQLRLVKSRFELSQCRWGDHVQYAKLTLPMLQDFVELATRRPTDSIQGLISFPGQKQNVNSFTEHVNLWAISQNVRHPKTGQIIRATQYSPENLELFQSQPDQYPIMVFDHALYKALDQPTICIGIILQDKISLEILNQALGRFTRWNSKWVQQDSQFAHVYLPSCFEHEFASSIRQHHPNVLFCQETVAKFYQKQDEDAADAKAAAILLTLDDEKETKSLDRPESSETIQGLDLSQKTTQQVESPRDKSTTIMLQRVEPKMSSDSTSLPTQQSVQNELVTEERIDFFPKDDTTFQPQTNRLDTTLSNTTVSETHPESISLPRTTQRVESVSSSFSSSNESSCQPDQHSVAPLLEKRSTRLRFTVAPGQVATGHNESSQVATGHNESSPIESCEEVDENDGNADDDDSEATISDVDESEDSIHDSDESDSDVSEMYDETKEAVSSKVDEPVDLVRKNCKQWLLSKTFPQCTTCDRQLYCIQIKDLLLTDKSLSHCKSWFASLGTHNDRYAVGRYNMVSHSIDRCRTCTQQRKQMALVVALEKNPACERCHKFMCFAQEKDLFSERKIPTQELFYRGFSPATLLSDNEIPTLCNRCKAKNDDAVAILSADLDRSLEIFQQSLELKTVYADNTYKIIQHVEDSKDEPEPYLLEQETKAKSKSFQVSQTVVETALPSIALVNSVQNYVRTTRLDESILPPLKRRKHPNDEVNEEMSLQPMQKKPCCNRDGVIYTSHTYSDGFEFIATDAELNNQRQYASRFLEKLDEFDQKQSNGLSDESSASLYLQVYAYIKNHPQVDILSRDELVFILQQDWRGFSTNYCKWGPSHQYRLLISHTLQFYIHPIVLHHLARIQ